MPNQITLAFKVNVANSSYGTAKAAAALAAVPLYANPTNDPVLGQLFGLTVVDDDTTAAIQTATRTIVLNMTSAVGIPTAPPPFPCNPITATPPVLKGASLAYWSEIGFFAVGDVVTGTTSGAMGTVSTIDDNGSGAGTLSLVSVTGTFRAGEALAGVPSGAVAKVGSLNYTAETDLFAIGDTVTGSTSLATGVVASVADNGSGAGTLTFSSTTGVFLATEPLTSAPSGTTATGGSALVPPSYYPLLTTRVLPGSFLTTPGSATVVTSDPQFPSLIPGATVQFLAQSGVFYTVAPAGIATGAITLTMPYTGPFSEDDGAVVMVPAPATIAAIYSTSPLDSAGVAITPALPPGSGARTVSLSYLDSNGGANTVVVSLMGTYPSPVALPAFPTAGFNIATITDVHIATVGGFGNSVGQITLSELSAPPLYIRSDADIEDFQGLIDGSQMLITRGLAYLPPSYFALSQQSLSQPQLAGEFLLPGRLTGATSTVGSVQNQNRHTIQASGGTSVATTVDQTSVLAPGYTVVFAADPNSEIYTIASVGPGNIVLTTPYRGENDNPVLSSATLITPSPAAEPTNAQLSGALAEFVNPGTAVPPPNPPLAPQTMTPLPTFLSGMFARTLQLAMAVPVTPSAIVLS